MKNKSIALGVAAILFSSCVEESVKISHPNDELQIRINLFAEIDHLNPTRADDSGFADGDKIGVYAVNYENGQPGMLKNSGNNADNVAFVFEEQSNRWNGEKEIFFSDNTTPVDVIGYYPYDKNLDEVGKYPISVAANQMSEKQTEGMSAYEASDFLWAKAVGVTSSSPNVTLTFKHLLSAVRVSLLEGDGFEVDEWSTLSKNVMISNTSREGSVNLSTGKVAASDKKDNISIVARNDRSDFRAIVVPQTVTGGEILLKITVGSHSYDFRRNEDMVFYPTRQHNFTIKVSKNISSGDFEFDLIDQSITKWESDNISHNGSAKEYIVVDLANGERLYSAIKKLNLEAEDIINLKLTGKMLEEDFQYIRASMASLEAINLYAVDLSECVDRNGNNFMLPEFAFIQMQSLKTCVLPERIRNIGAYSFLGTSLTGSLVIPEGVTEIGDMAFFSASEAGGLSILPGGQVLSRNNLTGTLSLPSTLKHIGSEAFKECDFSGSLILPAGLEYIGGNAFNGCKNFTGDLRIPESVKEIEEGAFAGMTSITGRVVLPENLLEIKGGTFSNSHITMIEWPKNLQAIESNAFNSADLKGILTIPESVIKLENSCFFRSTIQHINLPDALTVIPEYCFGRCRNLSDTLSLPSKLELIEGRAFEECDHIEALILPPSLMRIDPYAFYNCFGLNYIRCDAVEPPSIDDSVFIGVEKDNFTIEVPEQSVDAYRNAPGWCEFKRISAYKNFVARPSKYNVLNRGGKKEITLNADGDWDMIECPSWCHIDKTSGSKKSTLTLSVDPMAKGSQLRSGNITFKLKGTDGYLTHINVAQYDYQYDEDQSIVLQNATKGKGIDLVFIGDGYDASDIASGMYLKDMNQEVEYFFGVEPYNTYRDYFNVYTAFALSEDSGVEALNTWRNTKFHVSLGDGCKRLEADYIAALNYCGEVVPQTLQSPTPRVGCILVSNSEIYEGVTYTGDSFCAVVTKSSEPYPYDARGIIQHEAGGHGIGWLADEYIYHYENIRRCGCQCCGHVYDLESDQSWGFARNLSLIGTHKDVSWSHLIFNPSYGDIVDIYEGGYFHSRGVYRSELNSCMNNNIAYYSTWSRQLIVERIMLLAGEKFDLNSFYANDSRETGSKFIGTTRTPVDNLNIRHGQSPIKITGYIYGKKGGKR